MRALLTISGLVVFAAVVIGQSRWDPPVSTGKPMEFERAKLTFQNGDKKEEVNCFVVYYDNQLVLEPYTVELKKKGRPDPTKHIKYDDVASGEYTYGKSPRVAAAVLLSPFFLFSSSKSHWLTIKTKDSDYSLLRLDKSNYKLVIAELEKRAKIKVETVGENK